MSGPSLYPTESHQSFDALVSETFAGADEITKHREEFDIETTDVDTSSEFLLENARLLEDNQEFELARNIYRTLVLRNLNVAQGLLGLGRTFDSNSQFTKAEKYYREALAYESSLSTYSLLLHNLIRQGKDKDVIRMADLALGLTGLSDEQKAELHEIVGNTYARIANYQNSIHAHGVNDAEIHELCRQADLSYQLSFDLNPNSENLQVNWGSLYLQRGELQEARLHFQKGLELNSRSDRSFAGLGLIAMTEKHFTTAMDCFSRSLRINLNNLVSILNLIKCAYESKDYATAIEALERYIYQNTAREELNPNIHYSYCGLLYKQARFSAALKEVESILLTHPNHSAAQELKNLILKEQGSESQGSQSQAVGGLK